VLGGRVAAQHAEQAAHLGQRFAGSAAKGGELLRHGLGDGSLPEPVLGRLRLDHDQRHVVGHHVVHLPRDLGPFLKHRPPGPLGVGQAGLVGERLPRPPPRGGALGQHAGPQEQQRHLRWLHPVGACPEPDRDKHQR